MAGGVQRQSKRGMSQGAVAWRRFKKNKAALTGMFMIGVLLFAAAFADVLAKFPARPDPGAFAPFYVSEQSLPPSWKYPLGTSALGTDVYSEIIHASRYTLYVAVGATALTMLIAILVGLVAGYRGRYIDDALMRVAEIFLVFPSFLLILVAARIFTLKYSKTVWEIPVLNVQLPVGLTMVMIILAVFGWAGIARLVRGQVLSVRELEYITAAKSLGARGRRIIFRHVLPNVLSAVIVVTSLTMAGYVIAEAAVSFLGFGDPNTVTWGRILNENFADAATVPWAEVFPGLAVLWTVLGFNLLGDGLSDALNPRIRD